MLIVFFVFVLITMVFMDLVYFLVFFKGIFLEKKLNLDRNECLFVKYK